MQELTDKLLILQRGCWRHRWWGVLTAWLVAILGWLVVAAIPNQYEANAKVYVDTDSMLQPLLQGIAAQSLDVGQKMALVQTEMLSGPVLERVATHADMGIGTESVQQLVAHLRQKINIQAEQISRNTWPPRPPNLFTLGARDGDPQKAYDIVRAMVDVFVEDAINRTRPNTTEAADFLRRQIQDYERRLVETESRLTEFRRANIGRLPEQEQNYFSRLQNSQTTLDTIELELRQEQIRHNSLEQQLTGISPIQRATSADGTVVLSPLEERIQTLQERLDELLVQYTENHPEVASVQNSLTRLRAELEVQQAESEGSESSSNPMYQELRLQLGQTEANIAAITVRRDEQLRRLDDLRDQMETLPEVEAKLGALTRDYEVTQLQYNELLSRLEAAQMRSEADQSGQSINFRVVEPPFVPMQPFFPNRLLLSSVVLVFALGAGLGVAFLMSQIKPVFLDASQLVGKFQYQLLGTINYATVSSGIAAWLPFIRFLIPVTVLMVIYVGVTLSFLMGFRLTLS